MQKLPHPFACAAVLLAAAGQGASAPPVRIPEYQVKAEYLGVLAEYVTWPGRSGVLDKSRPFVIGILGASPFDNRLQETYAHRRIRGKAVSILHLRNLDRLDQCDAVFICESESDRLSYLLPVLRNHPVLLIGDTHHFANRGIMINLFLDEDRVKFEVNLQAARSAGFEIGSHLLKLARIIEP